jgi:Fe-S-cluster containining protein
VDIRPLARAHVARAGAPAIDRVDASIFTHRYFTRCMSCGFCRDWCCTHGVDVDEPNVERILARREPLERFVGTSADRWFTSDLRADPEHPGGRYRRTRVESGACVFLHRESRGCKLHAFCLAEGLDYHELKPMVSSLFPLTFDGGLLHASDEVHDGSLVCLGEGPTLYEGARGELGYYFGEALVAELDSLSKRIPSLPIVG